MTIAQFIKSLYISFMYIVSSVGFYETHCLPRMCPTLLQYQTRIAEFNKVYILSVCLSGVLSHPLFHEYVRHYYNDIRHVLHDSIKFRSLQFAIGFCDPPCLPRMCPTPKLDKGDFCTAHQNVFPNSLSMSHPDVPDLYNLLNAFTQKCNMIK